MSDFNRSGASRVVAHCISKAFDHKLKSYGILGSIFGLICFLFSVTALNSSKFELSQKYRDNIGVPQGSILGATLFLLYMNDLDDVICSIAIYADDTTLYYKYDLASDLS